MDNNRYIVFVDTSYLTRMSASEKVDWNKLLEHSKACVEKLDVEPKLEIYISEVAIREYRGQFIDQLNAKISKVKTKIKDLRDEWFRNEVARKLVYPLPTDTDIFPDKDDVQEAADEFISEILNSGITEIEFKGDHSVKVLNKYFDWEVPFDIQSDSLKDDKDIRKKRREHIPDAWILESAIDLSGDEYNVLCLCCDGNLSGALEDCDYTVYGYAKDVLQELFPNELTDSSADIQTIDPTKDIVDPLKEVLDKSLNENIRNIYVRLLGYVVPLNTPTHDELIGAVTSRGYDRKLTEACAVVLSDDNNPYITDTGSHYVIGNEEACNAAAELLTIEIIEMLEQS